MGVDSAIGTQLSGVLADSRDDAIDRLGSRVTDRLPHPRMSFISDKFAASPPHTVGAVIFWPTGSPLLADVTATFEHYGLRIADRQVLTQQETHPIGSELQFFSFVSDLPTPDQSLIRVANAFEAQGQHAFEVDNYAKLILAADLTWREVVLIRAISRFMRQVGLRFSESYVTATLLAHPAFVKSLVRYFHARFTPEVADRSSVVVQEQQLVHEQVSAAATLDVDRILRSFESFVTACMRTNWYQYENDSSPKRYAAFKLDSNKLAGGGPTVPYREIFVFSNDVEGIHARSGPVARGGLRFSDRPEDYRTEVLGLMKTQTVKNSPIVPVGAKGAFVRKNADISPAEAYAIFIRGLLDVTDNLVEGASVTLPHTVAYDDPDTYLVVAADKGTARLSDLANSIAMERDYWLGDAFASGGSHGYDHKAMGITARGAWVAVRSHLDALGIDADNDEFRAVGIGDMSGDVFGNGMLLSRSLRLVAAFDHRHIFIDPQPNSSSSYLERARLAALPNSTWDDYDRRLLSTGGGIWSRASKRIELSAEARKLLDLPDVAISPNALIKSILCAPVDLLWNGGIGTYIKASTEAHADAGDPTNDSVRVDANALRCRAIGEGGNLGLTQRARIQFALQGGRLNADFIDNAAGVATSDLEVNLKIALDAAIRGRRISEQDRDVILNEAEQEVTAAVLSNSESQALAIDLAESQAPQLLSRHERLIDSLEQSNGIIRANEVLPTKAELGRRAQAGTGLTRPEIAVLLAQSKNVVQQDLLGSTVPEDSTFAPVLFSYFPKSFQSAFGLEISSHRLAREIIATRLADDLINHVGPGLIYRLEERLGVKTPAVARAYAFVRSVFDIDSLWDEARLRVDLPNNERWRLLGGVQHFIEHTASWVLRHRPEQLNVLEEIQRYKPRVAELLEEYPSPTEVDSAIERLRFFGDVLGLLDTAAKHGCPVQLVAVVHAELGEILGLGWLTDRLEARLAANWWDSMALSALREDLVTKRHELAEAILSIHSGDGGDATGAWRMQLAHEIDRFMSMTAELRREGIVDVSRGCTVLAELNLLVRATRVGAAV